MAEEICESNNATLISIHSAEENEFIRNYVSSSSSIIVWIGLQSINRRGYEPHKFVWVDKSSVDYANWNLDKSVIDIGSVRYIGMLIYKNGTWNDVPYDDAAFVCGYNCK